MQIRECGRAENFEITVSGQDGSTICLLANLVAKLDIEGEVEHLDVHFTDISERDARSSNNGVGSRG